MIIKNVYFRKIQLDNDSKEEFKRKLGIALDMLEHVPETTYAEMNIDGFMDWATDLYWIKEDIIVIQVFGPVSSYVEDLMNEIATFWKEEATNVICGGKNRRFDFILMD